MTRTIHCVILLTILARPGPATANEPRGRDVLENALAAIGGGAHVDSMHTWSIEGQGRENLSAENQGLAPGRPTWRPHQESIAVDTRTLAVAWERKTPRNDLSLRWRRFVTSADSSGFYDWNARRGRMRASTNPESDRRGIARRVPHLLLFEAATRARRTKWLGEKSLGGNPHDIVDVEMPDGVQLELTLARAPAVLRQVTYRTHLPGTGDVDIVWEWRRWKRDSRLGLVPSGHRVSVGGVTFQEVEYVRYSPTESDAALLLSIPPDAPMATSSPHVSNAEQSATDAMPESGEVAPGIHVIEVGGFTVFFVEFRDFVVAAEAPESHPGLETIPASRDTTRLTAAFLAAIARAVPGKPVRYAILSHHHSDHMGGLREFAAAGVTLLLAPGHVAAARGALGHPHTLTPDAWGELGRRLEGRGRGAEAAIEAVPSRRIITDGERSLEVINIGGNPHSDENLLVWLPSERLLFQGDLFYFQKGGAFPPPGRETMNRFFAGWLRKQRIEPRGIYGVHNRGPAGHRELAASLP